MAQVKVKGLVLDEHREPVIGASVVVKGSSAGASTDLDGRFTISVPNSSTMLTISFVGYMPAYVAANDPALAQGIVLRPNTEQLDEVVVIGYGSVKKSDATGSVTAIKPDDLNRGSRVSVQDAMVGKIAGVNVVSTSGAPGTGAQVRIRSGASLSASNDPLFVIDGVPVDNSTIEGSGNVMGGINPDDIETFTVLKDASATAIYGSRASNGVIVITTKRGSDALKVNYSGNFAVSHTAKRLDVLSADEFRAFVPTVTGVPATAVYGTDNTDWQDQIFRTAFGTEHNASVSGTVKAINAPFRVSAGYTNQDGIIKNNNYERFTGGVAITPSLLNKHLTINANIKGSIEKNHAVADHVVGAALGYDPTRPVLTGKAGDAVPGLGYFIWQNGGKPQAIQSDNPVALLDLDKRVTKINRSLGSALVTYAIHGLEDLKLNANLGYDVLSSDYNRTVPTYAGMMYTGNQKDGTGLINKGKQDKQNYLLDLYANYGHRWGKHNVDVMGGYGWQHFWKKYNATYTSTEADTDPLKQLSTPQHYETENYLVSFFGRVNYSFNNRLMLTTTLRADASSRFAKENRWGYFPSVALAWRLIDEEWFKNQRVLTDLKVRLGYGVTGQQDIQGNDYPWMTTFSVSYPESTYQFGDKWYNTYRPNGYDKDIKWETTTTWNAGIDYGFLNGRIYGSVDAYKRYTKDLLNTIAVPAGVNYAPVITTNIGSMENQGVELSLNLVPVATKDFNWSVGLNYTWQKSKITKLNVIDSDQNFVNTGAISGTGKTVQVFMVDKTPYTFYLAKQAYDEKGNPIEGKYIQPDGSVGTTETKYADNRSAMPSSLFGLNTTFTYKNWDLGLSGHGTAGNYVYNYVRADQYLAQTYSDQGSFSNILQSTKELGFVHQQLYSDHFLENGSFFRIDNITLGYTFKKLWDKSSNLRVTAGVSNVHTFTKYTGLDPELYNGIDREMYPRPRTFSLGLNLNF